MGFICGFLIVTLLGVSHATNPCESTSSAMVVFSHICVMQSRYYQILLYNSLYHYLPEKRNEVINGTGMPSDEDGTFACSTGIEEIRSCIEEKMSSCSAKVKAAVSEAVDLYRNILCAEQEGSWRFTSLARTYLSQIGDFHLAGVDRNNTEVSAQPSSDAVCIVGALGLGSLYMEKTGCLIWSEKELKYITNTSFPDARQGVDRTWSRMIKCSYQALKRTGCGAKAGTGFLAKLVLFSTPMGANFTFVKLNKLMKYKESPRGRVRTTVVVFGDPHLVTFDGHVTDFTTCSAEGYQLYFENDHVRIYGYNGLPNVTGFHPFNPPTLLQAVSVELKGLSSNLRHDVEIFAVYNFTTEDISLPSTFVSGDTDVYGGFDDNKTHGASVKVHARKHVTTLRYRRAGMSISMRKASHSLTFSLRMAQSMFEYATGMLVDGCMGRSIDTNQASRHRRGATPCTNMGLSEHYLKGCEYDVSVMGEAVISDYEGIEEVAAAAEEDDSTFILPEDDDTQSSAFCETGHVISLIVVVLVVMFV